MSTENKEGAGFPIKLTMKFYSRDEMAEFGRTLFEATLPYTSAEYQERYANSTKVYVAEQSAMVYRPDTRRQVFIDTEAWLDYLR